MRSNDVNCSLNEQFIVYHIKSEIFMCLFEQVT